MSGQNFWNTIQYGVFFICADEDLLFFLAVFKFSCKDNIFTYEGVPPPNLHPARVCIYSIHTDLVVLMLFELSSDWFFNSSIDMFTPIWLPEL